jgi:hypothetical protein
MLRIREVPGLILGLENIYPDRVFVVFLSVCRQILR